MSTAPVSNEPPDADTLDARAVSELLRASVDTPGRPVDDVIERLRGPQGPVWFSDALADGPIGRLGSPATVILHGAASLDALRQIKEQSKTSFSGDDDDATRASGTLGYFLALAAAIVHHRRMITRRRREEVNEILVDLSDAVPVPWNDFLLNAAMADAAPEE